jgi:hypothetical protein
MDIPIQHYFRILVVGHEYEFVAKIIEEELDFATLLVNPEDAVETITYGSDLGAIIASSRDIETVIATRDARGLTMPVFMLSKRSSDTFSHRI